MKIKEFIITMDRGWELLQKRDFKAAEKAFITAYQIQEDITAINNIAFAIWHGGNPKRAWEKLEPYLPRDKSVKPNPFSFALAAQILVTLGKPDEARDYIDKAVKQFEAGLSKRESIGFNRETWYEYILQILKAAAALNDHRLVYDYYRRFDSYHTHWENHYLAGVAAFNLGRYSRAASIWGSLQHVGKFALHMQVVAFQVERGLIPPFPLDYEKLDHHEFYNIIADLKQNKIQIEEYSSKGSIRMILLCSLFSGEELGHNADSLLISLVTHGGHWGTTFALQLLESNSVDSEIKYRAALALAEKGYYKPGQEISIMVDGKEKSIRIDSHQISLDFDPELDKLNKKAIKLKNEERFDEALAILEPLYEQNRYYPQTMVTLANIYRLKKDHEQALQILEMVYSALPDYPAAVINLAGLCYETGDYQRAIQLINTVDKGDVEDSVYQVVLNIRKAAEEASAAEDPDLINILAYKMESKMREEVEMKALPLQSKLKRGLQNMPNEWLLNICIQYDLAPCDKRKEREELIIQSLTTTDIVADNLEDLEADELDLLRYLLNQGGWARLNNVTNKFGTMDEDGYYWLEYDPLSSLGTLWSWGLVMVGRAMINNRNTRVAAIPTDLREILRNLLF